MNILEFIPVILTAIGGAFGFGKLAQDTEINKRDIANIANLHRITIEELHEIAVSIARIEQRLFQLEKK